MFKHIKKNMVMMRLQKRTQIEIESIKKKTKWKFQRKKLQ